MTGAARSKGPPMLDVGLLRHNSPDTGAPAFLDTNLMRMTPSCMFMRSASGSVYGGRRGMSCYATLGFSLFSWLGSALFCIAFSKSDLSGTGLRGAVEFFLAGGWWYIGLAFLVLLSSFWMFIPWRRQLPLIFNRETGTVTAEHEGRIVAQKWSTSVTTEGVAVREGAASILFDTKTWDDKDTLVNVNIYATEHHVDVYRFGPSYGGLMVWEAIRHYMNGDDQAISICQLPDIVYRFKKWSDPFVVFNPFQIFWSETRWLRPLAPLGLLLTIPISAVVIPGELLYMWLDRVLPRRKWPQEMIDACGGIWAGRDD